VKAALRGLDMALEEGLDVKLVLIPGNEDPDSYVNKVGATAFREFVAASKKDFILFQLEVMLREAGGDLTRKNEVVNQVAETISKINRAEDFTRQQEYIRQSAALMKIDEGGLTNLVNKFRRDKISKEENAGRNKKLPFEEAAWLQEQVVQSPDTSIDNLLLLNQDEPYERNVLRVLLEYGLKTWDEQRTVADYIFEELEQFQFNNPALESLYHTYREQYAKGMEPDSKSFLYQEDEQVRNLVVNITVTQFELSPNWDQKIEGLNIAGRDTSHEDVLMSVNYFKLRKIKRMFDENQRDLEHAPPDKQVQLMEIHMHLKEMEKELTRQLGTVILK